jgi:DNA topoisomerase-1
MPKKPKTQGAAHLGEGGPKAEARATTLVVVESPAKARSIQKMLGPGYEVRASKGHVADLPERSLGVDVERGFTPTYEVKKDKKPVVEELKRAAQGKRLLIATDPDREGEAIGWHVARLLGRDPKEPIRVEFHEITPKVVRQAVEAPRPIDQNLVDAQQARRVLDRLVGYNLSPLLSLEFRKRALSAGRVQSVALRLVVEREEEIEAFQEETYFVLLGRFLAEGKEVWAGLYEVEGKRLWTGQGEKEGKLHIATEEEAQRLAQEARGLPYRVAQVETKERRKTPPPPFTTSTLQQAASGRLGYTASRTMRIAQRLYEGVDLPEGTVGLITYMRTDSVRVSPEALQAARAVIGEVFGPEYLPEAPRVYKNRKAGVQDAHEAIRPTDPRRTPESVRPYLSEEEYRLYDLIWRRFLASQMREALYEQTVVTFQDTGPNPRFLFRASGSVLKFEGYLKAWGREGEEEAVEEPPVPALSQGARAELLEVRAEERHTEPPPRYTDATLVKTMEELGIGRPSTYAPTLETLEKRGYVERRGRTLLPTPLGRQVIHYLKERFPQVVAYEFDYTRDDGTPTGHTCPKCGGRVLAKRSKRGKPYFKCENRDCDFLSFYPLLATPCPTCGWPLVEKGKKAACMNPACPDHDPALVPGPMEAKPKKAAKKKPPALPKDWEALKAFLPGLPEAERRGPRGPGPGKDPERGGGQPGQEGPLQAKDAQGPGQEGGGPCLKASSSTSSAWPGRERWRCRAFP